MTNIHLTMERKGVALKIGSSINLLIFFSFINEGVSQLYQRENWIQLRNIATITTYNIVFKDGKPTADSTLTSVEYFNPKHYKTKEITYRNDSSRIITEYGLKFDTLCVQERSYTNSSKKSFRKVLNEYNSRGLKRKSTLYFSTLKPLIIFYTYDKKRRLIKTVSFKNGRKTIVSKIKYNEAENYEEKNTRIVYRDTTSFPNNTNCRNITYFEGNRKKSIIKYDMNGQVIDSSSYIYNWPSNFYVEEFYNVDHPYYYAKSRPSFYEGLKTEKNIYYFRPNGLWLYKEYFRNNELQKIEKYFYTYY